jgi:transposase
MGTSSCCPRCGYKKKPIERYWKCNKYFFEGHKVVIGAMNMLPLAFEKKARISTTITYPLREK